jgi:hypothetical protein
MDYGAWCSIHDRVLCEPFCEIATVVVLGPPGGYHSVPGCPDTALHGRGAGSSLGRYGLAGVIPDSEQEDDVIVLDWIVVCDAAFIVLHAHTVW